MKPHEETWEAADGGVSFKDDAIATFWGACQVADPRAVLAAAAPEMARALLLCGCWSQNGALKEWHTHLCWRHQSFVPFNTPDNCTEDCRATHSALNKAGVLR